MRHMFIKIMTLFFMASASAQSIEISGNVKDNTGIPIPGVNVIVKNTSKGTITDFDGNFTLSDVEVGSVVSFSYIGYITKEIAISNNSKLNIQLEEDIAKLDEVVVIDMEHKTKKEITGAVSCGWGRDY